MHLLPVLRRWLRGALPLAALLPLLVGGGCIAFEKQTLVYRYDAPRDELRIFQVFEGIYAESATPTDEERAQLDSVFNGERTFFFTNWIFEFNRSQLEETLTELRQNNNPPNPALKPAEVALLQHTLANVKVANGQLFLNQQGQLCGYQTVTVSKVSQLIGDTNSLLNAAALDESCDWWQQWPPAAQQRVRAAAAKRHAWLRLTGNALALHLPLTHDYYLEQRRAQLPQLPALAPDQPPPAPAELDGAHTIMELLANDLQAYYANGEAVFTVGDAENATTTIALRANRGKYQPNLLEAAAAHGGIAPQVDLAALCAAFLGGPPPVPAPEKK